MTTDSGIDPTTSERPDARGVWTLDYSRGIGVLLVPTDWDIPFESEPVYEHLEGLGWFPVGYPDDGVIVLEHVDIVDDMSPAILQSGLPGAVFDGPRIFGPYVAIAFDCSSGVLCVPTDLSEVDRAVYADELRDALVWLHETFGFSVSAEPLSWDDYMGSSSTLGPQGFKQHPAVWGLPESVRMVAPWANDSA